MRVWVSKRHPDAPLAKTMTQTYCKFGKDCVNLIFAFFFAFGLGCKIKICNDYCCYLKCIAGTLCCSQFTKLKNVRIDFL